MSYAWPYNHISKSLIQSIHFPHFCLLRHSVSPQFPSSLLSLHPKPQILCLLLLLLSLSLSKPHFSSSTKLLKFSLFCIFLCGFSDSDLLLLAPWRWQSLLLLLRLLMQKQAIITAPRSFLMFQIVFLIIVKSISGLMPEPKTLKFAAP